VAAAVAALVVAARGQTPGLPADVAPADTLWLPAEAGLQPGDPYLPSTNKKAVAGSHLGSHPPEQLPAPDELVWTGRPR
jgi:hypothetical protein